MKYLIRSVKYFFYFAFLTAAIVLVLIFIGAVEKDINEIFEGGWNALWKMAIFFAVIAAIYPKFAFISRRLYIDSDWDTMRNAAVTYFQDRRLRIESETPDSITFRRIGFGARLLKLGEDRITLKRTCEGFVLEGMRKDVIVFATGLESTLS